MTRFVDGPASGVTLMLKRAPKYLRAVCDDKGNWDALDQLNDTPKSDERIVVYEMVGEPTWIHVCRNPRSKSGFFHGGQYIVVSPQPPEAVLRSTESWRAWVAEKVGQPITDEGTLAIGAQP